MKFEIKREEIISALSIGGQMAGKAKAVPILEFSKIVVRGPEFNVSSFNLETSITKYATTISADDCANFMVNADELLKAVRSIEDDTIICEVNSSTISVKHASGTMTMAIYDSKSYPEVVDGDALVKNSYDVCANTLKEWLTIGGNFVSKDDLRPMLNGVLIYAKNGSMGCCATDAHKLYTDHDRAAFNSEFEAVLPSSAIKPLLSVLGTTDEGLVGMDVDDKNFTFRFSGCTLVCRITEGTYPNFNAIIPRDSTTSVSLNKDFLSASVRRVGMFANKDTSQIKLDIKGDKIHIYGCDFDVSKQAKESLTITKEGDDLVISAKADFFSTCLSTITSDSVELLFNGATKPILFKDKNKKDKIVVLMPMICA